MNQRKRGPSPEGGSLGENHQEGVGRNCNAGVIRAHHKERVLALESVVAHRILRQLAANGLEMQTWHALGSSGMLNR